MNEQPLQRVLFVDDEPNVLEGIRRQLRGKFEIFVATSGATGLETLAKESVPIPVIVSDMRMPAMNGAEFLAAVRQQYPDSVRLILSGQSELDAAIRAVNEGHIFRFLTKPCDSASLIKAVESAFDQHRLVMAERELLDQTLNGTVTLLTEVLGLVNKGAFSKATRLKQYVESMGDRLNVTNAWELRLAAMLSQVGCLSVPAEILAKVAAGQDLAANEREVYDAHTEIGGQLLQRIPRLEGVARIVAGHRGGPPAGVPNEDAASWDPEVLGMQIVRAAVEFDTLVARGADGRDALETLRRTKPPIPPHVLEALTSVPVAEVGEEIKSLTVRALKTGMILDEDVTTTEGMLLVRRDSQVTDTILVCLGNYAKDRRVQEPIRVRIPEAMVSQAA